LAAASLRPDDSGKSRETVSAVLYVWFSRLQGRHSLALRSASDSQRGFCMAS